MKEPTGLGTLPMVRAGLGFAWLTYRNLLVGRRAVAVGVLVLLPPVVAALISGLAPHVDSERVFHGITFFYLLRFMVFLLALIFGMSLTAGEIEDGTVGYLYLGAVPRWLIVLVQIGVTAAALTALAGLSVLFTAIGTAASGNGLPPHAARTVLACTLLAGVGVLVSLSFYVTCGLAFRRPLVVSVIATLFWEFLVTQMPVRFAAYTVTNNLRALMLPLMFDNDPGPWFRYVKNFDFPGYGDASMFLSVAAAVFLVTAMVAAMNRSIEGKESR